MTSYAVITGASQGIGKSTAQYFLGHDWKVINISRRPCSLTDVQSINIDLSEQDWREKHQQKLDAIFHEPQKICLVHNAASYYTDNIYDLDITKFREMLEVNLLAAIQLNQIFLPKMVAGSSIIYIGSTLSEKAVTNAASYTISKHAVIGMMRATCQDLQAPDIHTCCICPGFTETEMVHAHLENNPAELEQAQKRVKANRLIQPEEIASLVYYCANHPVINGSVLHAHLGQIER